jgi:hypothetical protein
MLGIQLGISGTLSNDNEKSVAPSKAAVQDAEHMQRMTPTELEHHIAKTVKVAKAGEILHHKRWECVDGRCKECIVGTPGGDMGDLFLKLTAVEQVSGKLFSHDELKEIFVKAMKGKKQKFYMHADTHLVHHLAEHFHMSEEEMHSSLLKNPRAKKEKLLDELLKTENIACGHLKLIAQNAENGTKGKNGHNEQYPGARRDMLNSLMAAFYEELWNGGNVELVILEGDHEERAVAVFGNAEAVDEETEIPMAVPNDNTEEIFILHQGLEPLSDKFFARIAKELTGRDVDPEKLQAKCAELHKAYTKSTAAALAKGKPFFDIRYAGKDKRLSIKEMP